MYLMGSEVNFVSLLVVSISDTLYFFTYLVLSRLSLLLFSCYIFHLHKVQLLRQSHMLSNSMTVLLKINATVTSATSTFHYLLIPILILKCSFILTVATNDMLKIQSEVLLLEEYHSLISVNTVLCILVSALWLQPSVYKSRDLYYVFKSCLLSHELHCL